MAGKAWSFWLSTQSHCPKLITLSALGQKQTRAARKAMSAKCHERTMAGLTQSTSARLWTDCGFAQALAKCTQSAREQLGRRTAEKTDHRHHLLRGRYKRPRCGTAEKCNELASAHYNARGQSQGIVGYKKQPTERSH